MTAVLTGIELPVGGHSIRLHDGLEPRCELVHLVVGGRGLGGGDAIDDGRNRAARKLLCTEFARCAIHR